MSYNTLSKGHRQVASAMYPLAPAQCPSAHTPTLACTETAIGTQMPRPRVHTCDYMDTDAAYMCKCAHRNEFRCKAY